jgi:hypothetical protein
MIINDVQKCNWKEICFECPITKFAIRLRKTIKTLTRITSNSAKICQDTSLQRGLLSSRYDALHLVDVY